MRRFAAATLMLGGALAACDPADDVEVQPLPPAERPSLEARAGLPEIAGHWRFAGWEVPEAAAENVDGFAAPGDFIVEAQRLDSISGHYAVAEARFPFAGEVRRDSVVALMAFGEDGIGRYAAGRVRADTVWIQLSSFGAFQGVPTAARAAFVRTPVGQRFLRSPDGRLLRDTVRAVDMIPPVAEPGVVPEAAPAAPEPALPPDRPAQREPATPRPTEPVQREPQQRQPVPPPAPQQAPDTPRVQPQPDRWSPAPPPPPPPAPPAPRPPGR